MRVNVYAEEMTDRIEIISKTIEGREFTGLRFYLELPVTVGRHPPTEPVVGFPFGSPEEEARKAAIRDTHRSVEGPEVYPPISGQPAQVAGPFVHRPGDDDSAAVTFWGKRDLRKVLRKALELLDEHYVARTIDGPQPADAPDHECF